MTAKLEALRLLLDEAISESKKEIDSPGSVKSRRSLGSVGSSSSRAGGSKTGGSNKGKGSGWGDDNDGSLASDAEVNYWRKRYNDLANSKDPLMKRLEGEMLSAFDREDQTLAYVRKLESKIGKLEEKGSDASSKTKELTKKIEKRRKLLEFMEWLTSMSIKKEEGIGGSSDDLEEFVCTVKNAVQKRATRFSLVTVIDEEDIIRRRKQKKDSGEGTSHDSPSITYTPKANAELLPEYLQNVLSFEPDMAPVLLSDVLAEIYKDDEEEEEEEVEDGEDEGRDNEKMDEEG
jgi:hypothetical protein